MDPVSETLKNTGAKADTRHLQVPRPVHAPVERSVRGPRQPTEGLGRFCSGCPGYEGKGHLALHLCRGHEKQLPDAFSVAIQSTE